MQLSGDGRWITFGALLAAQIVLATSVSAMEVQLAGIRLDAPWVIVLDVYGCPDAVVTYGGEGPAAGGGLVAGGAGGAVPGAGRGGFVGYVPEPYPMPGPMGFGGPMDPLANAMRQWNRTADAMNAATRVTQMLGMGGAATGGGASGLPMWAQPVWVVLEDGEVEWFYRKGSVCLGFVFNRDGYVRVIAVAGEACDYARTSLWRPHRYVRLGDDLKRVLYRYGYPDEIEPFGADSGVGGGAGAAPTGQGLPSVDDQAMQARDVAHAAGAGPEIAVGMYQAAQGGAWTGQAAAAMGGGGAPGQISVTFDGHTNVLSRNAVVTYSDHNNIAFTLHDMTVTRICIWKAAQ